VFQLIINLHFYDALLFPVFDEQKGSSGGTVKKSNKPVRSLSQKTPKSSSLSVAPSQQNGTAVPAVSCYCFTLIKSRVLPCALAK